jgi:hypothetical protein
MITASVNVVSTINASVDVDSTIDASVNIVAPTLTTITGSDLVTEITYEKFDENTYIEDTILGETQGSYTSVALVNVASVIYKVNDVGVTVPFELSPLDKLEVLITRTVDYVESKVTLSGVTTDVSNIVGADDLKEFTFRLFGTANFDPSVTTSSGTVTWNFGDGSAEVTSNLTAYAYADAAEYTVTAKLNPVKNIISFNLGDDDVIEVKIPFLISLGGSFSLEGNPNLENVLLPTSSGVFTSFRVFDCASLPSLDMSGLSNIGGTVYLQNNTSLTSYTFPTSSQSITVLDMSNCNLTGTLDISGLTNINTGIYLYTNPLLTSVTTPVADTGNVTAFSAGGTDLTGTLDLSGYLNLGGTISVPELTNLTKILLPPASVANFARFDFNDCNISFALDISGMGGLGGAAPRYLIGNDNPLLPSITLPSNSNTMRIFRLYGCDLGYIDFTVMPNIMEETNSEITLQNNNMTAAEVNQILVELDSIVTGGYVGIINLGGNNAAADGTSGGYDGLTAKTNLIAKSKSVTTN